MNFLYTVVSFIIALGVLIVVHEYGHYLAARLCNVRVLRFSVGFGRPLVLLRLGRDATEWSIAAIPLGGYVKMLDEREAPVDAKEVHRAFNRQSVWRRFLIVIAGPVFNFLFAIAVYAGLYMHGLPETRAVLAAPAAGTLAHGAGFKAGDTVRSIEGEPVSTWQDLRWRVLQGALQREALRFEVSGPHGDIAMHLLDLRGYPSDEIESDALEKIGLRLFRPPLPPVIGRIVSGSAADRAGLRPEDRVVQAGGQEVANWDQLVQAIRARPAEVLSLVVERGATRQRIDVLPDAATENGTRIGRIGAAPSIPASESERIVVRVSYGPIDSLVKAATKTWDISIFTLRMLGKMLIGEVSMKHLSGPVTIADYAGQSAQMGWLAYATFLALISISLGVLNLLPIPLLDGGHLMYYSVEIIKGSPVSERAMDLGQRVGLALLIVVMAFAFYNDLNRLFSG
ncbi:MAG: RIP metalloprotease RseP [Candidatus Parcubacteria bacterium]|nr:RIP metalloprotease RseP [Burkholderiales bacterium]